MIFRPTTNQTVSVGASNTAGTAVGAQTRAVRVISTTACHLSFTGAATSSSMYLAANREEYFIVSPGQTPNVIQNTAGGTLHVTELTA